MDSKAAINAGATVGTGTDQVEALTGHPAVLRQTLSLWALLALSYSNMSVWTAIGGSLSAVFTAGGPVVMVWSWGAWAILAAGSYIQGKDEKLLILIEHPLTSPSASEILGMAVAWHPEYEQKPSHLVGVYLAILVLALLCNIFAVRVFDAATKAAAGVSIAAILAIVIALSVATPIKQEARWVFLHYENSTGWSSTGLVVLLGLLQ
ncbi:hypothetical protein RQP46_006461 [Phenoliferia psychrophenolica]